MKEYIHPLLERLGRVPDHYELYPLPDDKKGGEAYSSIVMTMDDGKVFGFEFDFSVDTLELPWSDNKSITEKHCQQCKTGGCPDNEDSWVCNHAACPAKVEYLKILHEVNYGKMCISV